MPVEGRLLPAFVQLLLQGPPAPAAAGGSGAGFGGSGGDADAANRLQEWRGKRQAMLLTVHEHLGELSHVLATLQ